MRQTLLSLFLLGLCLCRAADATDAWVTVVSHELPDSTTQWAAGVQLAPPLTIIRAASGEIFLVLAQEVAGPQASAPAQPWRIAFKREDGTLVPAQRLGSSMGKDGEHWINSTTFGLPEGLQANRVREIAMQAPATPERLAEIAAREAAIAAGQARVQALRAQVPFPAPVLGQRFEFNVVDADGQPRSTASFAGRPLVLEVWATWCSPCARDMERLRTLLDRIGRERVAVMGISLDAEVAEARAFAERHRGNWPHYVAGEIELGEAILQHFGNPGVPTYLLVDASGVLRHLNIRDELEPALQALLAPAAQ